MIAPPPMSWLSLLGAPLHALDLVGLVVLAVFAALGAVRGLWWQVARLIGVAGSVLLARVASSRLGPTLAEALPELDPRVASGLVWALAFVLGLAIASLFGTLGKRSLETLKLSLVDRFGGALAGLVTGVIVHAALAICLTQLGPRAWSADLLRDTQSRRVVDALGRRVPLLVDARTAERIAPWIAPADEHAEEAAR